MEEAGGREGSRYQAQCKEKNIGEEASETSRRPKVNAEIQIPLQKTLSIALHSIRTFVQERVFYQFGFVTLFYNYALLPEHCSEGHLSPFQEGQVMQTSGRAPCLQPRSQKVQQKDKILLLHFQSGISDAGGWDSTKAGEI